MARHPNQRSGYQPTRNKRAKEGTINPYELRKANEAKDVEALSQVQNARPLKPPGRR